MATTVSSSEDLVYQRAIDTMTAKAAVLTQSAWHYDLIETESTRDFGQFTYQVGFISTEFADELDRIRKARGTRLRSVVGLKIIGRLNPDEMNEDYKFLLALADSVRNAMTTNPDGNQDTQGNQKWRWAGQTYTIVGDGTHYMVTQEYEVLHHLLAAIF